MKSLLRYLAYTLMFTCCSASQASLFSDVDARLALLELRSRIDHLKEKSVASICSKNNPIVNEGDERLGDVRIDQGDRPARKAIKDLRLRVINLEVSCGITSRNFIAIKQGSSFNIFEDDELRRAILDLRQIVNILHEKIKNQVTQSLLIGDPKQQRLQIQLEADKAFYTKAFNSAPNDLDWFGKVNFLVGNTIKQWLEENTSTSMSEVKPPEFPPALKLAQEKWETNKEFEDRVTASRIARQKEIERLQADYKGRVDKRNLEIQKLVLVRSEKEKQLPVRKKELLTQVLQSISLPTEVRNVFFDQEKGILLVDVSIDKAAPERYAFKDAPQQVRRDALTSPSSLILKPDFFVSDTSQFGIKAINIESGSLKVVGTASQVNASSQALRLATIDVPISNLPALTQQSAITVDKNQVEQILYRDENESLRKRLEEQRKAQEFALAEETRKAAAETAKLAF
jgi:hypothetical protein